MTIDLNCDLAEGTGVEPLIMPFITSANISCGYHAGDRDLMTQTIRLCLLHGVAVGAHPSFPDRENFGRTEMNMPASEVYDLVKTQLGIIRDVAGAEGARLCHVKPHGALYNMAAVRPDLAKAIADAVSDFDSGLVLFGLSGSSMEAAAEQSGLTMAHEVFADRTYRPDGTLTPRSHPHALITDTGQACAQALALASGKSITTIEGRELRLRADTICLHGDGTHAVAFAKSIRNVLTDAGIEIRSSHHGTKK